MPVEYVGEVYDGQKITPPGEFAAEGHRTRARQFSRV